MGKLKMGEKVIASAPVSEQVVKIRHEIVEKPVFDVAEVVSKVEKPAFKVVDRVENVSKPLFIVEERAEVIQKPVFNVVDNPVEIQRTLILDKVSVKTHAVDWALRIVLGISAAVHLWSTFK